MPKRNPTFLMLLLVAGVAGARADRPVSAFQSQLRDVEKDGDVRLGAVQGRSSAALSLAHAADALASVSFGESFVVRGTSSARGGPVMASALASDARIPFSFRPPVAIGGGKGLDTLAVGDVTGDGRDDIVSSTLNANTSLPQIVLFEQAANGTIAQPVPLFDLPSYAWMVPIVLADMNRDGRLDIVAAHSGGFTVLLSKAGKSFTGKTYTTGLDATALGVIDLDQDGWPDVMLQSEASGAVVAYSDGQGGVRSFENVATPAAGHNDVRVGDLTGDGVPDLVLTTQGDNLQTKFWLYENTGKGLVNPKLYAWSFDFARPACCAAIGDFNGDGLNDLALSSPKNSPAVIQIYRQRAAGWLEQSAELYATYDIPTALVATDLDNDGHDDLVVYHSGWNTLGYYLQRNGGLGEEMRTSAGNYYGGTSYAISAGDLNGDGCQDVALATGSGVAVNFSVGCSPRPKHTSDPVGPLVRHSR